MLIGTFKGKSVHSFHIGGDDYVVRRSSRFVAAKVERIGVVCVLAPAGMSYQQAAMKAAHLRTEQEGSEA